MPNDYLKDFRFLRMWPRELMRAKDDNGHLIIRPEVPELKERGVYILYKDEEPYYVGRADRLWIRMHSHSNRVTDRYYAHWNYFSAFVLSRDVKDYKRKLVELEAILIAALPRAVNHSTPRFAPIVIPKSSTQGDAEKRWYSDSVIIVAKWSPGPCVESPTIISTMDTIEIIQTIDEKDNFVVIELKAGTATT